MRLLAQIAFRDGDDVTWNPPPGFPYNVRTEVIKLDRDYSALQIFEADDAADLVAPQPPDPPPADPKPSPGGEVPRGTDE